MRMQGPCPNAPVGPNQFESTITCTLRGNVQAYTRRAVGGAAPGGRIGPRARIKWEPGFYTPPPRGRSLLSWRAHYALPYAACPQDMMAFYTGREVAQNVLQAPTYAAVHPSQMPPGADGTVGDDDEVVADKVL